MSLLVTGGAGFIGGYFVEQWLQGQLTTSHSHLINLDALYYASHLTPLLQTNQAHYTFQQCDLSDQEVLKSIFNKYQPTTVLHFAAQTHVDNSIQRPQPFIQSNILAGFNLLEVVLNYWQSLSPTQQHHFKFIQVSTDEVYGSLKPTESAWTEEAPYAPNNPYSASKASADHLARAWHKTWDLPVIITHCCNNYGPRQHQEKLIPTLINKALKNKPLPLYGDGLQQREWLFVADHCQALIDVIEHGQAGEHYHIGTETTYTNLAISKKLCLILDQLCPRSDQKSYTEQITFVQDRLGHDRRYALNSQKIKKNLGWQARWSLDRGLEKTVQWYLKQG